jgi:hypothetical protein
MARTKRKATTAKVTKTATRTKIKTRTTTNLLPLSTPKAAHH